MTAALSPNEQLKMRRLGEASDWLMLMQNPNHSEEQLNEWLRWIDADPANFAEYERLQRDWKDLDALKDEALDARPLRSQARLFKTRAVWAVAAGFGAVALSFAAFHYYRPPVSEPPQQVAATVINRAATLPDGSKMILGAQSRVNMDFNGPMRQLDLSSGEAYFKVRHDKARPFVVQAGEVSVTAIGTAFDVRREQDEVTITVEEGIVEVTSRGPGKQSTTWRAEAGYQVTYSNKKRTASIASVNPAAELAWRNGELAYVREPLGSVIDDLNRYSTRKIVVEDAQVAQLRFTGTAFASSLDDWLAGIERAYPISTRRAANGDVILSSAR